MGFGLVLGLTISSLLFFIGFIYFGIKTYKKRFNLSFDIKNTFPYEINYGLRFLDNIGVNALLILSMASSIALFAFYSFYYFDSSKLVTLIAGVALAICIFFIYFADLKYIRFHIILVVLLAISAFMLPAGIGIAGYVYFQNTRNIYPLIIGIIALVVALAVFIIMMNPKFNFRLEMKKAIGADGKEVLVRPKYFVLAFSEWLFIFSIFVSEILLLLLNLPL